MFKVAFATADRAHVDQHFGTASGFAIYQFDDERARLVALAEFPTEHRDGSEDKLAPRIAALEGCIAVYCLAVGGSALRQLLASGIQPVRLDVPEPIDTLLAKLCTAVREGGVPWIDRMMRKKTDTDRFIRMTNETWQE